MSSLKYPLPQGVHASFQPTIQPDGSTKATQCPDKWQNTNCPTGVEPTYCPSGEVAPTHCVEYGTSDDGVVYVIPSPSIPTTCPDGTVLPTLCEHHEGSPIVPTLCAFSYLSPTHCEHDEGKPTVATHCPEEVVPTNCPDQKTLAQTNCSGDGDDGDGGEPTQCVDGSTRPTLCQAAEGQVEVVPTFCPPKDDPEIWPTYCEHEVTSGGGTIDIPTYCHPSNDVISTECPDPDLTLAATHCFQDGLPPLITTHCPNGEVHLTACPDDEHNPTFCFNGVNVCDG